MPTRKALAFLLVFLVPALMPAAAWLGLATGRPDASRRKRLVISASKRTDIPAFYLPWFAQGVESGFVEVPVSAVCAKAALPLMNAAAVSISMLLLMVMTFVLFLVSWRGPSPLARVLLGCLP